ATAECIEPTKVVALTSGDGDIVRAMTAYVAFLQGKERAGIERAMGATGFGGGKFAPAIHRNFVRLGAMQDAYAGMFRRYASPEQGAALDEALSGPVQTEVDRMRGLAYEAPFGGDISAVTGPAWFEASTRRIDAMKMLEDRLAKDVVDLARATAARANGGLIVLAGLLVALFLAVIVISIVVARSLANPLHRLSVNMARLAADDTSIEIVDRERGDEIGEMAVAVERLRLVAVERKELEQLAGAERRAGERGREEARVQNLRRYAEMLDSINRSTIDLARLAKNSNDASAGSQTISAAAEELVASVEAISCSSTETATEADTADQAASEGRRAVERVAETIGAIADATEGTAASMKTLLEASQQIGQILGAIQDISSQTNLLALNATIEAARAGEMGKGFAVVAAEVKSLASQTSSLTEEIGERIDALRQGISMIGANMEHSQQAVAAGEGAVDLAASTISSVSGRVTRVAGNMQEISAILAQQMSASGEIATSISGVTDLAVANAEIVQTISRGIQDTNRRVAEIARRQFEPDSARELCEIAKIDHILFKKRVFDTLLGGEQAKAADLGDHHGCRLGKWVGTMNDPAITGHPAFAALQGPHARVHAAAKAALTAHAAGRVAAAIEEAETMDAASDEVVRRLTELGDALAAKAASEAA
ncbi:MAG TPA: methyl-accepting chemotaxis protein, partial [Kaistiaceae bacterium]|nr:methyl-accepting chemotaxis protein [Kaistiaceae bacterium]